MTDSLKSTPQVEHLERILAGIILPVDIQALVHSFFQLRQNLLPGYRADQQITPKNQRLVYNFWQGVLTGPDQNKGLKNFPAGFLFPGNVASWTVLLELTAEQHFSGLVLQFIKSRIAQFLPDFLYHWFIYQQSGKA